MLFEYTLKSGTVYSADVDKVIYDNDRIRLYEHDTERYLIQISKKELHRHSISKEFVNIFPLMSWKLSCGEVTA